MIRVIPRLDIKGPNVVKGIQMEGLRIVGRPEHFAKHYYENGADELIYLDTVASLLGRNSLENIIETTAKEVFIPLTVGGGIRSVDDIKRILRAGADKVAINTAALQRPDLLNEAVRIFGSQCIVLSIKYRKRDGAFYECLIDNGREKTDRCALQWAKEAVDRGVGEIMLTSIDTDGTGKGFDIDITKKISNAVSVPVIASGGAGNVNHIAEVINSGDADAVSVASVLHYQLKDEMLLHDYPEEGNTDFLKKKTPLSQRANNEFKKIQPLTLKEIKNQLSENRIICRF